jgi:DNA polymerase-3 subunit epsilon
VTSEVNRSDARLRAPTCADISGAVEADAGWVAAGVHAPPATVGVYAFRDTAGRLLYVGSSRNLARRVRSYLRPGHAPASKDGRIGRLATSVEWRTCGSLLEALVLEARTIGAERPHFNRRLKQPGRYAWVRFDPRDPFPRLEVTHRLEEGAWRHLGPFPGGRRLARAVALLADAFGLRTCPGRLMPDATARACLRLDLGQCGAPCLAATTAGGYGRQLVRALAALGGDHPDAARRAGARPAPPAVPLPAALRATLRALDSARRRAAVVVVLPAVAANGHRLLGVAAGRLRAAASAASPGVLRAAFERIADAAAAPPPLVLAREELDEVRVTTAWLASREGRAATIDLGTLGREAAWRLVAARAGAGRGLPGLSASARPARR